jgi:hypothetical protein
MRRMIISALVAGLLCLFAGFAGPAIIGGDIVPGGNGAVPITMIGGDIVPGGNG